MLRIGLGCMGMSFAYGADASSDDPRAVVASAVASVASAPSDARFLLDTADVYGPFTNEELVGDVVAGIDRSHVLVASKCGLVATGRGNETRQDGRPEHIRHAVDASLRRLRLDRIDLLYLHRVDPSVPLEESWGALAELVAAGKLSALGLSEVTVDELERAEAVHPVAAVQSELSLFRRVQLADVVPWCAARGAAFVAYAPLGRGFLTGAITAATEFAADDFRARLPMFAPDAMRENQQLLVAVRAIALRHGATPGQVALAWALAQSSSVIAIPGTRRVARLRENLGAVDVQLSADEVERLTGVPVPAQPRYAPRA